MAHIEGSRTLSDSVTYRRDDDGFETDGQGASNRASQHESAKEWLANEIYFTAILVFNMLYNIIPFFKLKNLFLRAAGINVGRDSYIHIPVKFFSHKDLAIGDNVTVNPHCYLDARSGISIGNNVNIAHGTKIYTLGHDVNLPDMPLVGKPVTIEDDVFIFSNSLIMPGVTIGRGAVVFAGSVVVKDVAPYAIVGGNPAKFIMERKRLEFAKTKYGYWFAP